jgi:hypothetical protein
MVMSLRTVIQSAARIGMATLLVAGMTGSPAGAEESYKVFMDPLPPLSNSDGSGLGPSLLSAAGKLGDIKFTFEVGTFSRGLADLRDRKIDVLLYTANKQEAPEFYETSQEADWTLPARFDLFYVNDAVLQKLEAAKKGEPTDLTIATALGNKELMASVLGIDPKYLTEKSIDILPKMLSANRIDGIAFEMTSVYNYIKSDGVKNVKHKMLHDELMLLSMGLQKSPKGDQFKGKLKELFAKVDTNAIFADYMKLIKLPPTGVVN